MLGGRNTNMKKAIVKYTKECRNHLNGSYAEAAKRKQPCTTEHMVLAIISSEDSYPRNVLQQLGCNISKLREECINIVGPQKNVELDYKCIDISNEFSLVANIATAEAFGLTGTNEELNLLIPKAVEERDELLFESGHYVLAILKSNSRIGKYITDQFGITYENYKSAYKSNASSQEIVYPERKAYKA